MYRDKTILVTGASSGIGQALARRFASAGGRLILVARRADRLNELARQLETMRIRTVVLPADLTEPGACKRVIDEARKNAGHIDVLINNAGVGEYGPFDGQDIDALDSMMRLNMHALVRLTHAVLPDMIDRNAGHILNIASTAAYQPTPYMAVYGATKAFVLSFSMALWAEIRERGVCVTCVCPGPVMTEFFDRGGYETRKTDFSQGAHRPEQIAEAAFAAIRARRAAFVPGLRNKLGAVLQRFAPLRTTTRLTAKILGPTPEQPG
ncbi:MAG: SDR family NAD(P)-dependent oxidoreductase [Phycisphaerae bacterium]